MNGNPTHATSTGIPVQPSSGFFGASAFNPLSQRDDSQTVLGTSAITSALNSRNPMNLGLSLDHSVLHNSPSEAISLGNHSFSALNRVSSLDSVCSVRPPIHMIENGATVPMTTQVFDQDLHDGLGALQNLYEQECKTLLSNFQHARAQLAAQHFQYSQRLLQDFVERQRQEQQQRLAEAGAERSFVPPTLSTLERAISDTNVSGFRKFAPLGDTSASSFHRGAEARGQLGRHDSGGVDALSSAFALAQFTGSSSAQFPSQDAQSGTGSAPVGALDGLPGVIYMSDAAGPSPKRDDDASMEGSRSSLSRTVSVETKNKLKAMLFNKQAERLRQAKSHTEVSANLKSPLVSTQRNADEHVMFRSKHPLSHNAFSGSSEMSPLGEQSDSIGRARVATISVTPSDTVATGFKRTQASDVLNIPVPDLRKASSEPNIKMKSRLALRAKLLKRASPIPPLDELSDLILKHREVQGEARDATTSWYKEETGSESQVPNSSGTINALQQTINGSLVNTLQIEKLFGTSLPGCSLPIAHISPPNGPVDMAHSSTSYLHARSSRLRDDVPIKIPRTMAVLSHGSFAHESALNRTFSVPFVAVAGSSHSGTETSPLVLKVANNTPTQVLVAGGQGAGAEFGDSGRISSTAAVAEAMELDDPVHNMVQNAEVDAATEAALAGHSLSVGDRQYRFTTGLAFDSVCCKHQCLCGDNGRHLEHPGRVRSIWARLLERGLIARCEHISAKKAPLEHLKLVHDEAYSNLFGSLSSSRLARSVNRMPSGNFIKLVCGGIGLDGDTYFNDQTTAMAVRAAVGCLTELCLLVADRRLKNGMAIIRPPGHHAESSTASGFCYFNSVAIAAQVLRRRRGFTRIAIVDWDVHHGNGTQLTFEDTSEVLFISLHRHDDGNFFPGTGALLDLGKGGGMGYSINVAWSQVAMGDSEYLAAWRTVVMPILKAYDPEMILVSAGFDAAAGHPNNLGGYKLTPSIFGRLTSDLMSLADGKVVLALEGGYDLAAICDCAEQCTNALLGEQVTPLSELSLQSRPNSSSVLTLHRTVATLRQIWPTLNPSLIDMSESEATRLTVSSVSSEAGGPNEAQAVKQLFPTLVQPEKRTASCPASTVSTGEMEQ